MENWKSRKEYISNKIFGSGPGYVFELKCCNFRGNESPKKVRTSLKSFIDTKLDDYRIQIDWDDLTDDQAIELRDFFIKALDLRAKAIEAEKNFRETKEDYQAFIDMRDWRYRFEDSGII